MFRIRLDIIECTILSIPEGGPIAQRNVTSTMIAYVVVREGYKWRDVYRLTPGQVMTIGRAPTNRIVLHDDVCSRYHCEVFQNGAAWKIRALQSRNGTRIDGEAVMGEVELKPGQVIEIGPCE